MMNKLFLLFPNAANWGTISTAIPILGGIARKRGWEIEYFDTYKYEKSRDSTTDKEVTGGFKPGFSLQETKQIPFECVVLDIQKKLDEFQPEVLAITCLTLEYEFLLSFFSKIKIPEKTKVVIGGIHTTLMADDVIKTGLFDLVAVGEGEETFEELLMRIENQGDLQNIPGTFFMDRVNNKVIKNPRRQILNAEKTWDVDLNFSFFDDAYFIRPFDGKMIRRYDVDMGRGCPYNCAYCGNSALKEVNRGLGKYLKTRSFDSLFPFLRKMIDEFKVDIFAFMNECFLAHPDSWLEEFIERYAKECGKPFIIQTRAETITENRVKILKKAGVPFQVSIGVESGSEDILKNICGRSCTKKQIINAFDILQRNKIRTNAFFMLGLPYETRSDIFDTIELCRTIKPSVSSISIFQPMPGQELTKLCIEEGFITGNESTATFTNKSVLKMPPPYLSSDEITNLRQTFALYSSLPLKYFPIIEKCEKEYEKNKQKFAELVDLRWKFYDYANEREEMKLV